MKRSYFFLLMWCCLGTLTTWSQSLSTPEAQADSLMRQVIRLAPRYQQAIQHYQADTYIKGYTYTPKRNRMIRYMHWLTPVDKHPDNQLFELDAQSNYQAPNHYQNRIKAFQTSRLSEGSHYQELFAFINMNIYAPTIYDKEIITPLSPEADKYYAFRLEGSELVEGRLLHRIRFTPRKWSQKLLSGELQVVDSLWTVDRILMKGRASLEDFEIDMRFSREESQQLLPVQADLRMQFEAFGNQIITELHAALRYQEVIYNTSFEEGDRLSLDETRYYTVAGDSLRLITDSSYWASRRDKPLSTTEQALYNETPTIEQIDSSLINHYAQLGQRLTSTVNRDYKSVRMQYSGLFNPLQLSYGSEHGVTYKQELRLSHTYARDRQLRFHPEVGILFRSKQLRIKATTDWEYKPERRGMLRLTLANDNQEFPSEVIQLISEKLQLTEKVKDFNFKELDLPYYHHYYADLSNQIELFNGLTFFGGIAYHLRTPVQKEREGTLIKLKNANDFEPFIGLTYTPRQHYWMDGYRKEYLYSAFPTFRLELGKGIYGVMGSHSDYWRLETGLNQTLRLGLSERLSYNFSSGFYFETRYNYFANFRYFAKQYFPEPWRDRFGGIFHLLSSDWYYASERYVQAHCMYEAPFILLHFIKPRTHRYIVSERFYLSQLWTPVKPNHTEMGYGVGNDLLNVALFLGFDKFKYQGAGLKLSLELFR
ncbi:MAG: DUF5686 family protein [Parabacteroides sp.]|nr:DUF5686 family protein [Parabacteroides sp.]MDY4757525.1 DUF5686 family protein [Parabacteroides sp.]